MSIEWDSKIDIIPAKDVKVHIIEQNSPIVTTYHGKTYVFTKIKYLNVIENISYYVLMKSYNTYNIKINEK